MPASEGMLGPRRYMGGARLKKRVGFVHTAGPSHKMCGFVEIHALVHNAKHYVPTVLSVIHRRTGKDEVSALCVVIVYSILGREWHF